MKRYQLSRCQGKPARIVRPKSLGVDHSARRHSENGGGSLAVDLNLVSFTRIYATHRAHFTSKQTITSAF